MDIVNLDIVDFIIYTIDLHSFEIVINNFAFSIYYRVSFNIIINNLVGEAYRTQAFTNNSYHNILKVDLRHKSLTQDNPEEGTANSYHNSYLNYYFSLAFTKNEVY